MKRLLLVGLLAGCATTQQPIIQKPLATKTQQELFVQMFHGMFSAGQHDVYPTPINPKFWIYISTKDNVNQYLNRKELIIDNKNSVIRFKMLYDIRQFKDNIMNQFGHSDLFDDQMPAFTIYYMKMDCKSSTISLDVKENYTKDLKVLNWDASKYYSSDTDLAGNVVGENLCLTLDLMSH